MSNKENSVINNIETYFGCEYVFEYILEDEELHTLKKCDCCGSSAPLILVDEGTFYTCQFCFETNIEYWKTVDPISELIANSVNYILDQLTNRTDNIKKLK